MKKPIKPSRSKNEKDFTYWIDPVITIILPCSDRKKSLPKGRKKMKAMDLYDGPLFQTLRRVLKDNEVEIRSGETYPKGAKTTAQRKKVDKNDVWLDRFRILILSAKYGLLVADKPIPKYNAKLGKNVSKEQLVLQLRKQQIGSIGLDPPIYCFASREYSSALQEAGYSFYYVKGGIGSKRKILDDLLCKGVIRLWEKKRPLAKSKVEFVRGLSRRAKLESVHQVIAQFSQFKSKKKRADFRKVFKSIVTPSQYKRFALPTTKTPKNVVEDYILGQPLSQYGHYDSKLLDRSFNFIYKFIKAWYTIWSKGQYRIEVEKRTKKYIVISVFLPDEYYNNHAWKKNMKALFQDEFK